jgi:hypothetical protein
MRKVKTVTCGKYSAIVYRNAEWNEYVVKWSWDDRSITWYHTDDKEDAIDTAWFEVGRKNLSNPLEH